MFFKTKTYSLSLFSTLMRYGIIQKPIIIFYKLKRKWNCTLNQFHFRKIALDKKSLIFLHRLPEEELAIIV